MMKEGLAGGKGERRRWREERHRRWEGKLYV